MEAGERSGMEIKITLSVLRNTKSDSCNSVNAYKKLSWEPELSESVKSLLQGFLDLNRRLQQLEKKIRKV